MPSDIGPEHYFPDLTLFLTDLARTSLEGIEPGADYEKKLFDMMFAYEKDGALFTSGAIPCLKHQQCSLIGETCPFGDESLHIIIAGSTCTAWSSRGLAKRENDPTMYPFMIWIFLIRALSPDVVIHECTSHFNHEVFSHYLAAYNTHSFLVCPTQLGWPVHRLRRYTILTSTATVRWTGDVSHIQSFFSASMEVDGDVLYCSTAEEVAHECGALLAKRRVQQGFEVNDWSELYSPLTQER